MHPMPSLPGYRVLEALHESVHSLAFRALREEDQLPVVVKVLKEQYPPLCEVVRYRREFDLGGKLEDVPGILRVLELREHEHRLALVVEDFGAESLKKMLERGKPTLAEAMRIGIQVTRALGALHAQHVIHKDLNPGNILRNPQTGEVKVADFGLSSLLSRETPGFQNPELLEGTLAYIAPEQTGRMSCSVDHRCDLYSLGATLYQLLTGRLPFESRDPAELIHCHVAKQPAAPDVLDPHIPSVLSGIVLKLLAKSPDARYQSAAGVLADLETCQSKLEETGRIDDFAIASRDFSLKLQIPDRLYGRDAEVATLLQAFERVSQGKSEILLVSGYSGVGKTALIRTLFPPVTTRTGFFVSGKFDQLQRNRPYKAFLDAFEQLMRYLLSEKAESQRIWKERLLVALGTNGGVLTELIPSLALLIGPQPQPHALPPTDSQNRFNLVLQRFIAAFGTPQHPLVIFLDDLQWADPASLKLLQLAVTSGEEQSLLLLGAYRDNEVDPAHPLRLTLGQIQAQCQVHEVHLPALGPESVSQWMADTLRCSIQEAEPLARLLHQKTEGNPFFLREYLQSLFDNGHLKIDPEIGVWNWSFAHIQAQQVSDNAAELIVKRFQTYAEETRRVLQIAACLGNQFDLDTLSLVVEKSHLATIRALLPAVSAGVLIPLARTHQDLAYLDSTQQLPQSVLYRFAHDRVHQVIYASLTENQKSTLHQQIGQQLLAHMPAAGRQEIVFEVVEHLNLASPSMARDEKRVELAELNLLAGKRAKASAAYCAAWKYFQVALQLLDNDSWVARYDLCLEVHTEAAEAASLNADFAKMRTLTTLITRNGQTLLDKARAYQVLIEGYSAQRMLTEALDTAIDYLGLLGEPLPRNPGRARVVWDLLKTKWALMGRSLEQIVDLPDMRDRRLETAIRVMRSMSNAAYWSNPNLMALVIFRQVRMVLKHGNNAWSASVFASFGLTLCGVIGDINTGCRLGQLSLRLLETRPRTKQVTRTMFAVNTFIRHWKEDLRETLEPLKLGFQIGLEIGDFEWGTLCGHFYCEHSFFLGKNLEDLAKEMLVYSKAIKQLKQASPFGFNETFRQLTLNLRGASSVPWHLAGEAMNAEDALPELIKNDDKSSIFGLHFAQLMLRCVFRRYAEAVSISQAAEEVRNSAPGTFLGARFVFFDALARIEDLHQTPGPSPTALSRRILTARKKLETFAHHAPMNHLHLSHLIAAECDKRQGRSQKATVRYSLAIFHARKNGYLNDEALATELTARFYLEINALAEGKQYMKDAHYAYLKWGALAKTRALEQEFAYLSAQAGGRCSRVEAPRSCSD